MVYTLTVVPGWIFEKVLARLPMPATSCWEWPGSVNSQGYGKVSRDPGGTYYVHRIMYGWAHGWVPPEIDHLCRNRRCARPDHLEAVSHAENCARAAGTPLATCRAGHVWDEVGWWAQPHGRKCKACHRIRARDSARRRKLYTGG